MADDEETVQDTEPAGGHVCSVCGSGEFVNGPLEIGPVCVDCGTVASAEFVIELPDSTSEREGRDKGWTEYYAVRNSTEQQVASAFAFLEVLADRLDVPRGVRERAAELYGEAAVEMITDGRSTEAIIAGVLIIAGRELERPHPVGRVAEVAEIDAGRLRQSLSALRSNLDHFYPPCPPHAYLQELTVALDLDDSMRATARQILKELPDGRIGGKHPAAVAGAALYLAANGDITQRDVALVAGVTTETVRLRVKECREILPLSAGVQSTDGEQP